MTSPAKAPFHGPKADVILRTSDSVDFYSHKILLSLASTFFDQMFSIPQPVPQTTPVPDPDVTVSADDTPVPVIPMTEDSQTLDYLLPLCYPVPDPTSKDLVIVAKVLEAALKYEFEEATVLMSASLKTSAVIEPLKVYAIACRLGLEGDARIAAVYHRGQLFPHDNDRFGRPQCEDIPHYENTHGQQDPCDDVNCKYRTRFEETIIGRSYIMDMKDTSAGSLFRLLCYAQTGTLTPFCSPPSSTPSHSGSTSLLVDPQFLARYPTDIVLKSSDG